MSQTEELKAKDFFDGFEPKTLKIIPLELANPRNRYEGIEDTKRLDWLEDNEMHLVSNREKNSDGTWEIWWRIVKRGKAMSHPYGTIREAIDVAMARRK